MKTHSLARSIHLCLLAAAVAAPIAFAQDATPQPPSPPGVVQDPMNAPPPPPPPSADKAVSWKELDANKDGKLSKEEVAGDATWTADFDSADVNKDGFISKAEFKKHNADMKKMAMQGDKK